MTDNQTTPTTCVNRHSRDVSLLSDHAAYVHAWCNHRYYEVLLEAVETKAKELGLKFGPPIGFAASPEDIDGLAVALGDARRAHLFPQQKSEDAERGRIVDIEDGFSKAWLVTILESLQELGLFLNKVIME